MRYTENKTHEMYEKPQLETELIFGKEDEYWKDIRYYENLYMISNYGRIRNLLTGDLLIPWCEDGYEYVNLICDGEVEECDIFQLFLKTFGDAKE